MEHINVGTDEHSIKLEAEVSLLVFSFASYKVIALPTIATAIAIN
jgi:hypothetical protein